MSTSFKKSRDVPGAIVVTIRGNGVGMSPDRLEETNRRIVFPEAIDGSMMRSMGLIVVGRLAARHGITVRLRPTPGGGTTATVVLPAGVLVGVSAERPMGITTEPAPISFVAPGPTPRRPASSRRSTRRHHRSRAHRRTRNTPSSTSTSRHGSRRRPASRPRTPARPVT